MYFLKKLITSFVLPPGLIIIIFFLFAIIERKRKFIFYLSLLSSIFIYLISIEPFQNLIMLPLENSYKVPDNLEAQAVVVLGGGKYDGEFLKEDSINRVLTAYFIHKKYNYPLILSGGAVEGNIPESRGMGTIFKKLGVEDNKIIEESHSRDTTENAICVERICKDKKIKKIILVTSAYHMKRAMMVFKKTTLEIVPYPTDFKRNSHYTFYSFLPKFSTFVISIKAIREYIAIFVLYTQDFIKNL